MNLPGTSNRFPVDQFHVLWSCFHSTIYIHVHHYPVRLANYTMLQWQLHEHPEIWTLRSVYCSIWHSLVHKHGLLLLGHLLLRLQANIVLVIMAAMSDFASTTPMDCPAARNAAKQNNCRFFFVVAFTSDPSKHNVTRFEGSVVENRWVVCGTHSERHQEHVDSWRKRPLWGPRWLDGQHCDAVIVKWQWL